MNEKSVKLLHIIFMNILLSNKATLKRDDTGANISRFCKRYFHCPKTLSFLGFPGPGSIQPVCLLINKSNIVVLDLVPHYYCELTLWRKVDPGHLQQDAVHVSLPHGRVSHLLLLVPLLLQELQLLLCLLQFLLELCLPARVLEHEI